MQSSPARAALLRPGYLTTPEKRREPVGRQIREDFQAKICGSSCQIRFWFGLGLIFCIIITALVTWAVTKSLVTTNLSTAQNRKDARFQTEKIIFRGSLRFLIGQSANFQISAPKFQNSAAADQNGADLMEILTSRQFLCENFGDRCQNAWTDYKSQNLPECEKTEYFASKWPLGNSIRSYILHNSTFCQWHHCTALEVCCWRSPAESNIAYFTFGLEMRPMALKQLLYFLE